MLLSAGARGRTLCWAVLCDLSPEFCEGMQLLERDVRGPGSGWVRIGEVWAPEDRLAELADLVGRVDLTPLSDLSDPLALLDPLRAAVDTAMPWQPGSVRDALLALPPLRPALDRVATAIERAPAAAWWCTGVAVDAQYRAAEPPPRDGPPLDPAAESLAALRRMMEDAETRWRTAPRVEDESSGEWWSTPAAWLGPGSSTRPASTRRLPGLPAVRLAAEEDSFAPERVDLRRLLALVARPRVREIHGPEDWAALVAAHPFDVSRSRRGVWWQSTGIDGRWFVPDWQSLAHEVDAVHVSVRGYLTTAGEAVPVPGGRTVLAGWNPDETYWLCDVALGPPERWRRLGDAPVDWLAEPEHPARE